MTDTVTFDRAADYYDQTRGFPPGQDAPIAAFIAQTGGLTASSTVLEIGIGTGRIALPLARHVGAVYGVDISRAMMERLRAKDTDEAVSVAQGDARRLPYPDHVFDAAVVVHVLHLIPNWQQALGELARVLKPNGLLLHGWTDTEQDEFWSAINSAKGRGKPTVGMSHEKKRESILGEGWQLVVSDAGYRYSYPQVPQEMLDSVRARLWSTTWRLTDDELDTMVAGASETLRGHYGDLKAPIEIQAGFRLDAFRPPMV